MSTQSSSEGHNETYGSVRRVEHLDARSKDHFEDLRRNTRLGALLGHVPEFLVFLLQKHHGPPRLAVKRCGRVEDGIADNVLDARIGNLDVIRERVQRTSILKSIADRELGCRHGEPRVGVEYFRLSRLQKPVKLSIKSGRARQV